MLVTLLLFHASLRGEVSLRPPQLLDAGRLRLELNGVLPDQAVRIEGAEGLDGTAVAFRLLVEGGRGQAAFDLPMASHGLGFFRAVVLGSPRQGHAPALLLPDKSLRATAGQSLRLAVLAEVNDVDSPLLAFGWLSVLPVGEPAPDDVLRIVAGGGIDTVVDGHVRYLGADLGSVRSVHSLGTGSLCSAR